MTLAKNETLLSGEVIVADGTPPLTCLAASGTDVPAGQSTLVLPATAGRVHATVQHLGTIAGDGTYVDVYVCCGQAAAEGIGELLTPGQQWSFPTADAVSVYATGAVRVATTEWAAG